MTSKAMEQLSVSHFPSIFKLFLTKHHQPISSLTAQPTYSYRRPQMFRTKLIQASSSKTTKSNLKSSSTQIKFCKRMGCNRIVSSHNNTTYNHKVSLNNLKDLTHSHHSYNHNFNSHRSSNNRSSSHHSNKNKLRQTRFASYKLLLKYSTEIQNKCEDQ